MKLIDFRKVEVVYLIGIGGIGMSALARFFKRQGKLVAGYDRTATSLTATLEDEGIQIYYSDSIENISKEADLVIYTPAVPDTHLQLSYYVDNGYSVFKRSEVLGMISREMFSVAIAGTHGKTTITSMLAHILHFTGRGCTAFIGGVSKNYGTNFLSSNDDLVVVEADEYDRSFLQLRPNLAVVSAIDSDHLDIYGDLAGVEEGFRTFTDLVQQTILVNHSIERKEKVLRKPYLSYHHSDRAADYHAVNIEVRGYYYLFDLVCPEGRFVNWLIPATGMHNLENAIAAIAVALGLGVHSSLVRRSMYHFEGIKRRFEYVLRTEDLCIIDDYAHHPKELSSVIAGARQLHPGKYLCVIFQPHLYSRTRDLADEFARALEKADEVILLDIYPAREEPIDGVSSYIISERMAGIPVSHAEREKLPEIIASNNKIELLLITGAGDIDKSVDNIESFLKKS